MSRTVVLFKNEVLKARKRLAFWVTTGVFAFFIAAGVAALVREAFMENGRPFAFPEVWERFLPMPAQAGPIMLAVLVILLFAPEFQWRTARQNVIDGLSKEQFYWGKLMVLPALVVLFLAVSFAIAGVGAVVSPSAEGSSSFVRRTDLSFMLGYVLLLVLWGSTGFLLAALIRASGPAIGVLMVYILVEQIMGAVLGRIESLRPVLSFLPQRVSESLGGNLLHYPDQLPQVNAGRVSLGMDPLDLPAKEALVLAALAYSALFLVLAFFNLRKRDL